MAFGAGGVWGWCVVLFFGGAGACGFLGLVVFFLFVLASAGFAHGEVSWFCPSAVSVG